MRFKLPVLLLIVVQLCLPCYAQTSSMNRHLSVKSADLRKLSEIKTTDAWRNPIIEINDATISVGWLTGKQRRWKEIQPDELEKNLLKLPASAWPYGRIAVWTMCGVTGGSKKTRHYRQKSQKVIQSVLRRLDVVENPWPSA